MVAWLLALSFPGSAALAAEPVPGELASGVTPEARAVLDRMTAYLGTLQRFSIEAHESRDEVLSFGYKLQHQQHATLLVQRPDRMRADVDGDVKARSYVYDGETLTVHAQRAGVYAQLDAPGTIAETIDVLLAQGVEMPLVDVLAQAFRGTLAEGVRAGMLVGDSRIDGVAVSHLAFRQATIDWQLWVEKGDRPLPRKLLITTRYEYGEPQYEAVLEWNLEPTIARDAFTFAPPDGARRIRFAAGGAP
jgi:hypothetical protein